MFSSFEIGLLNSLPISYSVALQLFTLRYKAHSALLLFSLSA